MSRYGVVATDMASRVVMGSDGAREISESTTGPFSAAGEAGRSHLLRSIGLECRSPPNPSSAPADFWNWSLGLPFSSLLCVGFIGLILSGYVGVRNASPHTGTVGKDNRSTEPLKRIFPIKNRGWRPAVGLRLFLSELVPRQVSYY
jgi:hypothetical protein